ncbi:hypothetical protein BC939DRAFT_529627 [Gamsiella multidivaricata]|uniref:uncharacterized protein n=1 Tax=Gamsiella multidivaricata TaxID=101098 RepID=UPI002220CD2C|nr:uncharacterized protein BC939DRAFT_529627 [Gamsiella multidivaricata]KAI7822156.1 hypothetical protein BC939DRAFT_529627 [Gamsiella multidivaricata]
MSKYWPLFELHQLVQLTHSTTGKTIFYSQVHLASDDHVDEDEAGGWVLSAFTGKTYFEREYRRDDLNDLLTTTGDKDWSFFARRFKKAILEGYFHIVDTNPRECKLIVDNDVHSRTGSSQSALETIEIEMFPVNHATRGEKLSEFMFECTKYIQARGCSLMDSKDLGTKLAPHLIGSVGSTTTTNAETAGDRNGAGRGDRNYDDLKLERDNLKTENAELKQEIERLHANALKANNMSQGGLGAASGRPKSKNAQMAMMVKEQLLKKRKGVSALNPRMKRGVVAKGTEFGSDDDDDDEDDE